MRVLHRRLARLNAQPLRPQQAERYGQKAIGLLFVPGSWIVGHVGPYYSEISRWIDDVDKVRDHLVWAVVVRLLTVICLIADSIDAALHPVPLLGRMELGPGHIALFPQLDDLLRRIALFEIDWNRTDAFRQPQP